MSVDGYRMFLCRICVKFCAFGCLNKMFRVNVWDEELFVLDGTVFLLFGVFVEKKNLLGID